MKVSMFILCHLFLNTAFLNAQLLEIPGQVIDAETKQPIYGANIFYGSCGSTITDTSGHFIAFPHSGETITIVHNNYKYQVITIEKYTELYIKLEKKRKLKILKSIFRKKQSNKTN